MMVKDFNVKLFGGSSEMKKNIFTNNGNLKEIVKNRMLSVPAKPAFNLNQRERSVKSYTF